MIQSEAKAAYGNSCKGRTTAYDRIDLQKVAEENFLGIFKTHKIRDFCLYKN